MGRCCSLSTNSRKPSAKPNPLQTDSTRFKSTYEAMPRFSTSHDQAGSTWMPISGGTDWRRRRRALRPPTMSHLQIQTLLAAIGNDRKFDIWVPMHDRAGLDWSLTPQVSLIDKLPVSFDQVRGILQEIDVVWIERGSGGLAAAYEVEHSTPIYSGLLRLNDIRLINPKIDRLTIVSDEPRRVAFMRQLGRPTFQASSLSSVCTFLEYSEVYEWHRRLKGALTTRLS